MCPAVRAGGRAGALAPDPAAVLFTPATWRSCPPPPPHPPSPPTAPPSPSRRRSSSCYRPPPPAGRLPLLQGSALLPAPACSPRPPRRRDAVGCARVPGPGRRPRPGGPLSAAASLRAPRALSASSQPTLTPPDTDRSALLLIGGRPSAPPPPTVSLTLLPPFFMAGDEQRRPLHNICRGLGNSRRKKKRERNVRSGNFFTVNRERSTLFILYLPRYNSLNDVLRFKICQKKERRFA
jgi:hypothetical protein